MKKRGGSSAEIVRAEVLKLFSSFSCGVCNLLEKPVESCVGDGFRGVVASGQDVIARSSQGFECYENVDSLRGQRNYVWLTFLHARSRNRP